MWNGAGGEGGVVEGDGGVVAAAGGGRTGWLIASLHDHKLM